MALNEFDSDTHRRVCANLTVPRSVVELAEFLERHDPFVDRRAYSPEGVEEVLRDLEAARLVKRLPGLRDGKAAVKAMRQDKDVQTLPRAKASAFMERVERDDVLPAFDGREYWVATKAGLERLTGRVRDEPPALSGRHKREVEAANRELAKLDKQRVRDGLLEEAKRLRERAADLQKAAKE
jgi:hypothetical protein